MSRPQPARHGVGASQARVLRLPPQIANAVARVRTPRERRPLIEGRRWYTGALSCTSKKIVPCSNVFFQGMYRPQPARHGARVLQARAAPAPYRQPARWHARVRHANAGWSLEAAAGTLEHGLAPKKRGFSPVQCLFIGHGPTTGSTSRRARFASARAAPPPHR